VSIPFVIGLAAWSGTGKTTLLTRLIPLLRAEGLRVALIKHAHHAFDIDHPGKDSYELRKAGACEVIVASSRRIAHIIEQEDEQEPQLSSLLQRFDPARVDLVLVEGFRHAPPSTTLRTGFAKIELHRAALGKPLLFPADPHIVAVASDAPLAVATRLPRLDLNDAAAIARFILDRIQDQSP
jgi:molybdopterin-guanine dinucleotide biosynthesis protein B